MLLTMKHQMFSFVKDISMRTGVFSHRFFDVYPYMFEPDQLCFLCECLDRTHKLQGCCVEAGCAYGWTTAFLNRYMNCRGIEKPYFAIDTFGGFVAEHSD